MSEPSGATGSANSRVTVVKDANDMDPISLIVAALVQGILACVSSVGQQATVDCYQALKGAITRKYGDVGIGRLERDPDSVAERAHVEDELRRASASVPADEIVRMADDLLQLIERGPIHATGVSPEVETAHRRGCTQAIDEVLIQHLALVMDTRSRYPVSDEGLLSTSIVRGNAVPAGVVDDVQQLHTKMRTIMGRVAESIESMNYQSAESDIADMHLAYAERKRAEQLINEDKEVHISFQTLKTTVDTFSTLNEMIISRIERSPSPHAQTNLILGNAILVY